VELNARGRRSDKLPGLLISLLSLFMDIYTTYIYMERDGMYICTVPYIKKIKYKKRESDTGIYGTVFWVP
jgi:hypothetical protein